MMGWRGCRVAQDDIIWKRPDVFDNLVVTDADVGDLESGSEGVSTAAKSTIGFHQDSSYISYNFVPYQASSCTLWIALDDADSGNGGLSYAVGSQSWSTYDIDPVTGARDNRASSGMTFMSGGAFTSPIHEALHLHNAATGAELAFADVELATPVVPAGSALLHLQDTWHGSAGNTSKTRERRAIAVHFIEEGSKFRPAKVNKNTPWGDANYIYGRYRSFGSDEIDGSFLPCTWGEDDQQEQWIERYLDESQIDWRDIGSTWKTEL